MWRETRRNIQPCVRWKLKYVFLTKRTWCICQKYCFGEHEKQLGRKKQAQIFARSYSRREFNKSIFRSLLTTTSKHTCISVPLCLLQTLRCAHRPGPAQPRFFFPSLSRFVAQNHRPRIGDECSPAAKASGKRRHRQQDHTQWTLRCWPTGGWRPIPIPTRPCAGHQEPSVSCRMRPHGLVLGILPRGVVQMIQSHQQQ